MRILIAERDPEVVRSIQAAIAAVGRETALTSEPAEAGRLVRRGRARILLLGTPPGDVDAPSFVREFRKHSAGSAAYVFVLVEVDDTLDPRLLETPGADDVLRTPLLETDLALRLRAADQLLELRSSAENQVDKMRDMREEMQLQNAHLAEAINFMEAANHRFAELFAGIPIACFTFDSEGRIHEWNRASEALYGVTSPQAFLKPISDIIPGGSEEGDWMETIRRVFHGESIEGLERTSIFAKGRTCHVLYRMFPLYAPNGAIVGAIAAGVDLSARKRAEAIVQQQMARINEYSAALEAQKSQLEAANSRLEVLAVTDCLTGVGNYRAFRDLLEWEKSRAEWDGTPLSILLLDVDHFKLYNDSYGHLAGDHALQAVGQILATGAPRAEHVARYGGEEFVVLLPQTGGRDALAIAERLRAAIQSHEWDGRQLTVSIGVSTMTPPADDGSALIAQADSALYACKRAGRNRVAHACDLPLGDAPQLAAA